MYKITLDDGTKIQANLNMNTWESDTEPDDSVFIRNTKNVSYETPEGETVLLGECHYIRGIQNAVGKYLFFLNPVTAEEKRNAEIVQQRSDIDYIAMEMDIDLE